MWTLRDDLRREELITAYENDVGQLCRNGKTIWYAFIGGPDGTYREHTSRRVLAERIYAHHQETDR